MINYHIGKKDKAFNTQTTNAMLLLDQNLGLIQIHCLISGVAVKQCFFKPCSSFQTACALFAMVAILHGNVRRTVALLLHYD